MVDEKRMTKRQVVLAKKKSILLEKFGMVNQSMQLKQRIDTSYDVEKVVAKGYSLISLDDGSLKERLCKPQIVGKEKVVIGQQETRFFLGGSKTNDITEERDKVQIPDLHHESVQDWMYQIPLSVLQKMTLAKRDGFKHFQIYYPEMNGRYKFKSKRDDPVVIGYISQSKYKNCNQYNYSGQITNPCIDKRLCARSHWTYYPIGPAFEIADWDQCDVDKEGI